MADQQSQAQPSFQDEVNARLRRAGSPASQPDQNRSYLADLGTSIGTGLRQLPGIATGLADIAVSPIADRPFSRGASALGEFTGFQPSKGIEANNRELTPETRQAQRNVEQAEGFFGTLGAYLQNPRAIGTDIAASLPATAAGGGVGGAIAKTAAKKVALGQAGRVTSALAKPAVAAGVGEGAVSAGAQMQNIDENVDPFKAAVASTATGAGVGLIAGFGARLAQKIGIGDPELLFTQGRAVLPEGVKPRKLTTRIFGGAVSEGIFQEMPQGSFEQLMANYAEDRPLLQDIDKAAVQSMIAGMGMGALAGPFGPREYEAPAPTGEDTGAPDTPDRPALPGITDISNKQLIGGMEAINDLLSQPGNASAESQQILKDALRRAQDEVKRRELDPGIVNRTKTLNQYAKTLQRIEDKQAVLAETRLQDVGLADVYEEQIAQDQARLAAMEEIYPDIREEVQQDSFTAAVEQLARDTKAAESPKNRAKKNVRDRIQQNTEKVERMLEENPELAKVFEEAPVEETQATAAEAAPEPAAAPAEQAEPAEEPAEPETPAQVREKLVKKLNQKAGKGSKNKPIIPETTTAKVAPEAVEVPQGLQAFNSRPLTDEKVKRRYVNKNGTISKKGMDDYNKFVNNDLETLLQYKEQLSEINETEKATPLTEAQEQLVEDILNNEKGEEYASFLAETRAKARQMTPLTTAEMDNVLQIAKNQVDVKRRLTKRQLEYFQMWSRFYTEEGRDDPIAAIQLEMKRQRDEEVNTYNRKQREKGEEGKPYRDYAKPPGKKEIIQQLGNAKGKIVRALMAARNLPSQELAEALLGPTFYGLRRSPGIIQGQGQKFLSLLEASATGDADEIRIAKERARIMEELEQDIMLKNEQNDAPSGYADLYAAAPEGELSERGRANESAPGVAGQIGVSTAETIRLLGITGVKPHEVKKLNSLRDQKDAILEERDILERQLSGLQSEKEALSAYQANDIFEPAGQRWDALGEASQDPNLYPWAVVQNDPWVVGQWVPTFSITLEGAEQTEDETRAEFAQRVTKELGEARDEIVKRIRKRGLSDAIETRLTQDIEYQNERLQDVEDKQEALLTELRNKADEAVQTREEALDKAGTVEEPAPEAGTIGAAIDEDIRKQLGAIVDDAGETYAEAAAKAEPVQELPTFESVKSGKRVGPKLDAIRRENLRKTWVAGKEKGTYSTVGPDGLIYTAVNDDGQWKLYTTESSIGVVDLNNDEEYIGDFPAYKGKNPMNIQDYVDGQVPHGRVHIDSLDRIHNNIRKQMREQGLKSDAQVSRRKAVAEKKVTPKKREAGTGVLPISTAFEMSAEMRRENIDRITTGIDTAIDTKTTQNRAMRKRIKEAPDAPATEKVKAELKANEAALRDLRKRKKAYEADPQAAYDEDLAKSKQNQPRQSVAWQGVRSATTVEAATAALNRYIPVSKRGKVRIVKSMADVENYLARENIQIAADTGGFIHKGNVFIITDNVQAGREAGVLMHEVGVHMAMSKFQIATFAQQIRDMARSGNELAMKAMDAVDAATDTMSFYGSDVDAFDEAHEIVAYFVEEAVNSGINPTQLGSAPGAVRKFFRNLMTYIRTAMRALGLSPSALTAQDVVDAAYGAADTVFRRPASDERVRLSVQRQYAAMGNAYDQWLNQNPKARASWQAVKVHTRRLAGKFMFGSDFADWVGDSLPSARRYFNVVAARVKERGDFDSRLQAVMDPAGKFSQQERDEVNQYFVVSQKKQAWGFKPHKGALQPEKRDPVLTDMFAKLQPKQQTLVKDAFRLADELQREYADTVRGQIEYTAIERMRREPDLGKQQQIRIDMEKDIASFNNTMMGRRVAWMPLRRHGEFAVVGMSDELRQEMERNPVSRRVRDLKAQEAHYYVEFTNSARQAAERVDELKGQGFATSEFFERQAMLTRSELVPYNMINSFRQQLEASEQLDEFGQARNVTASAMVKALNKFYIQQLTETSIRKSELERVDVAGFDRDMIRNFVEYGSSIGGTIAGIKMNRDTQASIQAMRDEAGQHGGDRIKRTQALNEIMERHAINIDGNVTPWQNRIMGVTSFWMLLSSPAYYMQNSTQPWMLTLPVLAGQFGFEPARKLMMANYKVIKDAWMGKHTLSAMRPVESIKSFGGELADLEVIAKQRGQDAADMMETLQERGLFDVGVAADLGNLAGASFLNRVHRKFVHAVRSVEVFNRGVTALTAYELAKRNPGKLPMMTNEQGQKVRMTPTDYAIKQVMLTQGDYSGHNAPSIISKLPFGKVMTQFRKFQLIQIGLLTRLVHGTFFNADPMEKAAARRQLGYVLGAHGIAGGALGLPMANIAGMMIMAAFGDDNEPEDFELMLRREIGDDDMADLLLKGLPAFFNVDVSAKVGMGQTFSVMPFTDLKWSRDGAAMGIASLLGGPTGAQAMQWADAVGLMQQGDYGTAFAQAMPRGIRDATRALMYSTEGVRRRNPTRDTAISADEFTAFDIFMQGIGLPSERVTDRQNKSRWLNISREHLADRSSAIKAQYVIARQERDAQGMLDARRAWMDYQKSRAAQGFKRQPISVLTDAYSDKVERERNAVDGVFVRSNERRFLDLLGG